MSCVHYKFFSKLNYATVTFNGQNISLRDLKRQIMGREKLKVTNCDLQVTNAQSREEYTDDNILIPKNSSVIVRRIPVKTTSKTNVLSKSEPTADLAGANASEEDKIKAMMIQSCRYYEPAK
ncbi:E3 ubiquitin-protein ligase RBBP6-like [Phaethornis superciliosus]